ncbi:MAG: hypothetical protein BWY43_00296 [candidate division WS2 bacterium ADurb.Bin280]|uniref:Uncharacterized protein n=1 Tax=candidate division WS2 bacterium ADurb.Bin280 TaxID=1852829 RepID=A0A1V5SEN2_9BACT|nr:MAG: hypothetical protein BWY43_00296 [candidate division WS2 bacterium ADurb.Bin280]
MESKEKRLIKNLSVCGAIFTIIFGSVSHFFYQWSNQNIVLGLFFPVNESVWEHMKMVFTPMIIFAFVDFYYLRKLVKNYCFALIKQIGVAIAFIIIIFYIYSPVAQDNILAIDITSFIVGIFLAKYLGYKILTGRFRRFEFKGINITFAFLLILATAFFVYATFDPPKLDLFLDKTTNIYGIN